MNPEALGRDWDVVVIGAGVAGAVAAYLLARRGLQVLLVEKASWPRAKACGGCVNAATLQLLSDIGISEVGRAGPAYHQIQLACGKRHAEIPLPAGHALSRSRLDDLLVEHGIRAGVHFLPSTQARLQGADSEAGRRSLLLRQARRRARVRTRLVLACDGLGSRVVRDETPDEPKVSDRSRIGLGTTLDDAPRFYRRGTIHMACGAPGYVGLVRVENGGLNIGAALDPAWVKARGGPAPGIASLLRDAGFPAFDALNDADWQGTPHLSRKRARLGAARVLIAGDAAGYVEPFTGEGIGWAVAGAVALEPLAVEAVGGWRDDMVSQWTMRHGELLRARQRGCHAVTALLRHSWLVSSALLPLLSVAPGLASPLTAWLNRGYRFTSKEGKG